VAAVAAILGHCFPVWLGFRGGKGVASALGVFLALTPISAACTFAVFLVIVLITRYVSLASIIGSATFPLFGLYFVHDRSLIVIAGFVFIPLLIILKHQQNIRRLLAGTESRFGAKKAAA
jgi:glycerol-3-phosphate acyltransferase PlsY